MSCTRSDSFGNICAGISDITGRCNVCFNPINRVQGPDLSGNTEPVEPILKFFPTDGQFHQYTLLAQSLVSLPRSAERTVALRKLLESLDAARRLVS